jgi:hypothetical protein
MAISHVDLGASLDAGSDAPIDRALEAYTFAYPLVLMDATRRVATHVERADCELGSGAPINEFSHLRHLLGLEAGVQSGVEADGVSRPNLDALYSFLWFDVSSEPLIIDLPDAQGRFYALSLVDHWGDVFASVGARTTGTAAQTFAITAPSWAGELPHGVRGYPSPTARGWLFALALVRGMADIPQLARFQARMQAVSWSKWRSGHALGGAPVTRHSPAEDPKSFVAGLSPSEFFERFCELTRENPPHPHDGAVVDRLRSIGIVPGQPFWPRELPRSVRSALELAKSLLPQRLEEARERCFRHSNQWRTAHGRRGARSTDYLLRASRLHAGIGAHASADAVDFTSTRDAAGAPLRSSQPYTLTFQPGQLPPARAYWSLTLYDQQQKLAANALGRYTLGSNDDLLVDPDGSLTLHIQRDPPAENRERNWLPAPAAGTFSASLRLYWPERAVLDGEWSPPPLRRGVALAAPRTLWFARDRFDWAEDA